MAPATPAWTAMRLGTGDPGVGKSPAWAAGRRAAGLGHRTLLRNGRPCGLSRRQCPPGTRVLFPERRPQASAGGSGRWGWDSPPPEPHSPHPASGRNSSSSVRGCAEPEGGHGGNMQAHSVGAHRQHLSNRKGASYYHQCDFPRLRSGRWYFAPTESLGPGLLIPVLIHSVTLTATMRPL